jgi:hypothetical protein
VGGGCRAKLIINPRRSQNAIFFSTASREEKTNTYSAFLDGRRKDKPTKVGQS